MKKYMNADDLKELADVVWKRMAQLLNSAVSEREKEWNHFFIWVMSQMEESIEREYPHTGRIVRAFKVEKKGERCVEVSTLFGIGIPFTFYPTIKADEALEIVAEVVNFIEGLDGFIIWNRFPKDNRKRVDDFQVIVDYSSKEDK